MPKVHGLWRVVVIVVTCGLLLFIWRSPHRDDLEKFWSTAAAVVAVSLTVIVGARSAATKTAGKGRERALEGVADLLGGAVKDQWARAAAERQLLYPEPIPVRWERSPRSIAGPVSAAVNSRQFAPLPGLAAVRQGQLHRGGLRDLHAIYGGLGSGRMVIVGAPGSGKSAAAVLLVLAAVRHREQVPGKDQPRVPVPVMFTVHGWDPNTEQVQDWLAARLRQTYPLFAGKCGAADASALVRHGKIAAILDGLDEMPERLRPVALRALSGQADFRVVVLTRCAEMDAAAENSLLEGAVALELQDVLPSTSADYLASVERDPPPAGWRELIGRVRRAPDSPIAKALSNPLALTLVRDTYRSRDDVRELLDFCLADGNGASREDIIDHLLDRVLPAAYARRPGDPPPRYDLQTAQHALHRIAGRMNQDGARDLKWWDIPTWATPATPRVVATMLTVGLVIGLAAWVAVGFVLVGIWVGLMSGITFGLAGSNASPILAPVRWRRMLADWSVVALGLMAVTAPLVVWAGGRFAGMGAVFMGFSILIGRMNGIWLSNWGVTSRPGVGNASALSPLTSWRRDRTWGFSQALTLAPIPLGMGLIAGLAGGGVARGLGAGVVLELGLLAWACSMAWWRASLAFAQLAVCWHTPVRLLRFLEDARGRNVLRTVGPFYQFRHARLQDRLAEQAATARDSDRQDRQAVRPAETV
jgi:hypothetical protein